VCVFFLLGMVCVGCVGVTEQSGRRGVGAAPVDVHIRNVVGFERKDIMLHMDIEFVNESDERVWFIFPYCSNTNFSKIKFTRFSVQYGEDKYKGVVYVTAGGVDLFNLICIDRHARVTLQDFHTIYADRLYRGNHVIEVWGVRDIYFRSVEDIRRLFEADVVNDAARMKERSGGGIEGDRIEVWPDKEKEIALELIPGEIVGRYRFELIRTTGKETFPVVRYRVKKMRIEEE